MHCQTHEETGQDLLSILRMREQHVILHHHSGELNRTAIQINCRHVSVGQASEARRAEYCLGGHPNELATQSVCPSCPMLLAIYTDHPHWIDQRFPTFSAHSTHCYDIMSKQSTTRNLCPVIRRIKESENAEAGSLLHLLRKQALVHNDILRAMVATKAGRHATISSRLGADTAVSYFFSLSKTCPLYMTSKPFFSATSLSVGYRKGFRLRRRMDQIFRHLRDSGILGHLYERELPNATKCSRGLSIESDTRRALDLGDFFGVMCVYGGVG
ncbi:hypothetical protein E2C01_010045 [Portunus trituberculatus]|uniref:Uncharacterized protein n=1 Tax=Portunus trituberculatus TaxID=210409 RepID=A0A5B7D7L5_PORTR|nr:hypothetical protein [Portunus trituberculatus]